ncbi:GRAM domain-containing protein 2B-like [Tachyglossus aculeatus]|uniref:GRAM domain-containing protein 2B-like n=1 Tax=Tachyglossus aculeatus TaxID=9261 RepID=UPI0018F5FD32|nr:GRAM domain-containing protein 2B-like [Tachyglossus aculeatus]XP_038625914.1 GRAM domain-containing protein 2B-like [Tachyglossus aculeatus]
MEEFSNSESRAPEFENFPDFHVTESQATLKVIKREVKPVRMDQSQGPEGRPKTFFRQDASSGTHEHFHESRKSLNFHRLLIFYAVLFWAVIVCIFYLRCKIYVLEKRVESLASFLESYDAERKMSEMGSRMLANMSVVCEKLTANVLKLEKVQDNLQKLLKNDN